MGRIADDTPRGGLETPQIILQWVSLRTRFVLFDEPTGVLYTSGCTLHSATCALYNHREVEATVSKFQPRSGQSIAARREVIVISAPQSCLRRKN